MASENFHEEMKKWNDENKLLDLAKYKLTLDSSQMYWAIGIILTIFFVVIQLRESIGEIILFGRLIGPLIYAVIMIVGGIILVYILKGFSREHKKAYDNISYLSRKIDGQYD